MAVWDVGDPGIRAGIRYNEGGYCITQHCHLLTTCSEYLRLEDLSFQEESDKKAKMEKWQEITVKTSTLIADSRAKLDDIKSKDPQTTPEIHEQIEEIQVSHVINLVYVSGNAP